MTGVKITGLTINSDSITIDYSGGDGPSPVKYGYKACNIYWDKQVKNSPNKELKGANAIQLANIWILATGDLKGARTGKVDGCGSSSQKACLNTCISAVTQALGECQALHSFLSKDKGNCKVKDKGGGIWQVSNYNTDTIKDSEPSCKTLQSLTNPCCAARAAFTHAKYACSSKTFTSGNRNGQLVPDCPRYKNTQEDWDKLSKKGSDAHVPCWNGPFCVDAGDGDWLQDSPPQQHPSSECESKNSKSTCIVNTHENGQECIWYNGTKSQCLGGFAGWEDSWSKYAYARCCDDNTGCKSNGLPLTYSCFNPDGETGQHGFDALKKFALGKGTIGLGQSYLEIATDACKSVITKYY